MSAELSFEELLAGYGSAEHVARLARFAELLERWSKIHNLVRAIDRRDLVERHILDALAADSMLGPSGCLLDVGSGAGLPGVPLLLTHPQWRGVLLEPRQKRWAFLRLVIRELDLEAEALRMRYQEYDGTAGPFDVITARAVGGYSDVLDWAWSRLSPHGQVVLWTTTDWQSRLAEIEQWHVLSSALPGLERGRLIQMRPCFT